MGKLKDRLYYKLVTKHPLIKNEYESYVQANPTKHKNHPIKSWWFLFRLNFHYRVLRKKKPMIKKKPAKAPAPKKPARRLPYLNGSESLAFQRRNAIFLAKDLLDFDVISFDIFDTLVLRPFSDPKDLFDIVGCKVSLSNFRAIRTEAEQTARNTRYALEGHSEINIFDIYEEISRKTGLDSAFGIKTELEVEENVCFANPYMQRVFKILQDFGKRIIITSDMYIPHDDMEVILKKCGYEGYEKLYVSCDYGCNKRLGGLYKNIVRELGDVKIAHVGDNVTSDINSAISCGVTPFYYKNCHEMGNPYRADGLSDLIGSFYSGIVNTHLHNGVATYSAPYEYGFIYGGLYILGFCNWIYTQAKAQGVDKILFLARDGDIYRKVFHKMFDDMPTEYVYWSRIANTKYTVKRDRYDFLLRMVKHKAYSVIPVTYEEVLESVQLSELIPKLKDHKMKPTTVLSRENIIIFENFLIENWDYVREAYEDEKHHAKAFFENVIGNSSKVGVVDIGYVASGPLGIKYLIENEWKMDCEVNIFIAASHYTDPHYSINDIQCGTVQAYMFDRMTNRNIYDTQRLTNKGMNNLFLEIFTQACTPSFNGFDTEGNYRFDVAEVENYDTINEVHQGILDFADLYLKKSEQYPYLRRVSGYDAYCPFRFIIRDPKFIKNTFADFTEARGVGGSKTNYRIEKLSEIWKQVNL